jgi:hypothetical protein
MIIPIYRPEITIYERTTKNREWSVDGWVSKLGTVTNTLFYPISNGLNITETGFKVIVENGEEPFYQILAPEGCYLAHHGRATLLDRDRRDRPSTLYFPDGKAHDAINAVILAKHQSDGLGLVRPGRPRPVAPPAPPLPRVRRGPALQLDLFPAAEGGGV